MIFEGPFQLNYSVKMSAEFSYSCCSSGFTLLPAEVVYASTRQYVIGLESEGLGNQPIAFYNLQSLM